ncbi:MAG TPA: peptidoglycan editing factor PgeF [Parvularcula sp.]|nr:peptidoglycan editing factor PgeF [Parvularcula sp.]HBS36038.1 peptidoglycan editing factor PgeF [Parvularcula sp.]
MSPPHLKSAALPAPHGFFGRAGGVSTGIFSSLNAGLGSGDGAENVAENRKRCRDAIGAGHLLTLYQVHSADAVIVEAPWEGAGPRADGMATRLKGVALGVLAADCMPFLFIDAQAEVIGAAHAGWRGALAGVLGATIGAMERLGAKRDRIRASLGPCLRQPNFEVGLDVRDAFSAKHPDTDQFFAAGVSPEKRQFDLAGFGRAALARAGVGPLDDLGACTLGEKEAYFSYRASRRANEPDYGRNLSAIALG